MPYGLRWTSFYISGTWKATAPYTWNNFDVKGNAIIKKLSKISKKDVSVSVMDADCVSSGGSPTSWRISVTDWESGNFQFSVFNASTSTCTITKVRIYVEYYLDAVYYDIKNSGSDISNLLYTDSYHTLTSTPMNKYGYPDGINIVGIQKKNSWEIEYEPFGDNTYYQQGSKPKWVKPGSIPLFDTCLCQETGHYGPGNSMTSYEFNLYIDESGSEDYLVLHRATTGAHKDIFRKKASDFREGVIPDCVLVILTAGGGSGGGSSAVFAGAGEMVQIGGNDGGGGGAGSTAAFVLNLTPLKEDSGCIYRFYVGHGGNRVYDSAPVAECDYWAAFSMECHSPDGNPGQSSSVAIDTSTNAIGGETMLKVGPGAGGKSAHEYNGGEASDGPSYVFQSVKYEGVYWWNVWNNVVKPDSDKCYVSCHLTAAKGGARGSAGESTDNYSNAIAGDSWDHYKDNLKRRNLGGYSGGSAGDGYSGGGGASFYAKGGDGGGTGSHGNSGSFGSGGGAGRYTYGPPAATPALGSLSIRNGGEGGDGVLEIWY